MSKKVLVIDDSPSIRQQVSLCLTQSGFQVVEASDGRDALNKLDQVAMAVCDVNMPGMNGIEFIKEVRTLPNYKFMPILFLTTESQQSKRLEAKAAGASGWLVKPATADELLNTIKLVLK